jgi:aryl-alcohol dehydrogenase-like predicted oxidoreductase
MIYRNLGRAGVKVSVICMGTAQLVEPTPWEDSIDLVRAALDAGVNFFDTANVYGDSDTRDRSERVLGEALRGRRDETVIATKFRGRVGPGPNDSGTSRYHIMRQVERSLQRLQTDRIDLYQTHGPDPDTPIEETLRAMDDLVRQGKVLYTGMSNSPGWHLAEAMWTCDRLGLEAIVSEQTQYSLVARGIEREVLPFARAHGIGVLAYSPIGGGLLTGKYRRGTPPPKGSRGDQSPGWFGGITELQWQAIEVTLEAARETSATAGHVALAWVLSQEGVSSAIVGPHTREQLKENLGALDVTLDATTMAALDES